MGIASEAQRERAQRLIDEDPCCRAMMSELRELGGNAAALLPLPAATVTVASGHGGLGARAAELLGDFKAGVADLASRVGSGSTGEGGAKDRSLTTLSNVKRHAGETLMGAKQHAASTLRAGLRSHAAHRCSAGARRGHRRQLRRGRRWRLLRGGGRAREPESSGWSRPVASRYQGRTRAGGQSPRGPAVTDPRATRAARRSACPAAAAARRDTSTRRPCAPARSGCAAATRRPGERVRTDASGGFPGGAIRHAGPQRPGDAGARRRRGRGVLAVTEVSPEAASEQEDVDRPRRGPCLRGPRAQVRGRRYLPGGRLLGGLVKVQDPRFHRLRDARHEDPARVREQGALDAWALRRQRRPARERSANSRAVLTLRAPAGMQFASLSWTGSARRTDCRYEIEMAAVGPRVAERLTKVVAGKQCPRRGKAQSAGRRARGEGPRNIRGADRIVLRVLCKAKAGKRCSTRRANYARFGVVNATVEDVQAPTVSITGGDLVSGRWVRGEQPVSYTASDQAGVQTASVLLSGASAAGKARPCDNSLPVPCATGPTPSVSQPDSVRDGTHQAVVVASDAAGNPGVSPPVVPGSTTRAPLQVPVIARGGEAWRATQQLSAPHGPIRRRAMPRLSMPRSTESAASAEAARTRAQARTLRLTLSSVEVPAPGEWTLRVWRRDQAGQRRRGQRIEPSHAALRPRSADAVACPGQLDRSDADERTGRRRAFGRCFRPD